MAVKEKKARKMRVTAPPPSNTKRPEPVPEIPEIPEDVPTTTETETKILGAVVFLLSCAVYGVTMYPGLPMGDSGEFMVTAIDFGVSHPPGYPLFTTMCYLALHLIPVGPPAWRINLLSVLFGALFNLVIFLLVSRIGRNSVVGLLAAGWIGFSRLFWMWSIQGEIFSLNNFFCALLMLRAYHFEAAVEGGEVLRQAKISALVSGLSLSNQHTSILYIAPFALRVAFRTLITEGHSLRDAVHISLYGLAGMAWYLQMPLSNLLFSPRVTWGDFSSAHNLIRHMLRLDYGSSFVLVAGSSSSTFLQNFAAFARDSTAELSLSTWLCAVFLVVVALRKCAPLTTRVLAVLLSMLTCYFAVFCSLANIDLSENDGLARGVLERFWMQPSVGLIVLAGVGLCKLLGWLADRVSPLFSNKHVQLVAVVALLAGRIKNNFAENDESGNLYSYHYANSILPLLPANSLMLTGGDLPTNVFRYHTICEQIRPDVRVLDMQFMAADWFRDILAPTTFAGVDIPGVYRPYKTEKLGTGQYNLAVFLDRNIDKFDIFVCNSVRTDETSYTQDFYMIPVRTCKQFMRKSKGNPVEVIDQYPVISLNEWPMPQLTRYGERTWEHTLMTTYINGLGERGNMLWMAAVATTHPQNRRYLLEHGFVRMQAGVAEFEGAIARGELAEEDWAMAYDHLGKNLGHFCMILRWLVEQDGDKAVMEERLPVLEACGRKYWQIFVDYAGLAGKEKALVAELRKYLALKSFMGLRFAI